MGGNFKHHRGVEKSLPLCIALEMALERDRDGGRKTWMMWHIDFGGKLLRGMCVPDEGRDVESVREKKNGVDLTCCEDEL